MIIPGSEYGNIAWLPLILEAVAVTVNDVNHSYDNIIIRQYIL
jgi:hypothetical protein